MTAIRPLLLVLLATACATTYLAWIDNTSTDSMPSVRKHVDRNRIVAASVAPSVAASTASVAAAAPLADVPRADLFRLPEWRLGARAPSGDEALPTFDPALPPDTVTPPRPTLEISAIWQDSRGVMVMLNHADASRIACSGCDAPGSLQPGQHWRGYRLNAVGPTGANITELATGQRRDLFIERYPAD
nr:hypothetical protein [uncultured Cupriavidus sp.]